MHASDSIVVLTTSERCDLFRAAVGSGADLRLDSLQTAPLETFLVNIGLSGATLCVLDEDHFSAEQDMQMGIDAYVDDPIKEVTDLRLLLVCSGRKAGDALLRHYAGYCGIYDIICGCDGAEITNRLAAMLRRENKRLDVLDLLREKEQPLLSQKIQVREQLQEHDECISSTSVAAGPDGLNITVSVQIDYPKDEASTINA